MKTPSLLLLFLLFQTATFSQEPKIDLKEYFTDAEYFLAQEEYVDALYDFQEVYNNGYKDNANVNYRIGVCYLNIPGQKDKSIPFLLEAVKNVSRKWKESTLKQTFAPVDAYLFLGNAYRVNDLLSKAIESYNKYKELAGSDGEINFADQQISACNTAIRYMDSPLPVRKTNLGDSVNGASSNFKAVVSGDGFTLAYMNELPFYKAVYVSHYTPKGWTSPVNITPQIQSDGDQFVSCLSYDGKRLYLTREDAFNSDIYMSDLKKGKWTKSVPLEGQEINTKYWESHASVSRDGKTLYFTSNRKGGIGEMDIYKSQLQSNGQWGAPVNMGNVINTTLNEDTPFITENDSILYFSSQGHENMGGYDIFKSVLGPSGQWSAPENIRYPLNTTDDDLFYYPWHNGRILYASLIQQGGFGKEDIYAIQAANDEPLSDLLTELLYPVAPQNVPALAEKHEEPQTSPAAVVAEKAPVTAQPEPVVKETVEKPAAAAVTEKPAAAPAAEPVLVKAPEKPVPAPVAAPAAPITPVELELKPVYFAFDHFQLSSEGEEQLRKVFAIMKDNPGLQVKLVGHADAKGTAVYNLGLSQKRATAAMDYLIHMGIDKNRLSAIGMGTRKYAAMNINPDGTDNPEGRRLNRRVEYEITGVNNSAVKVILPPVPEKLRYRE